MARFRINTAPYAGEYDLDLDDEPLTMLEWRWIKKLSGYMPATIGDGVRGADPDVTLALGVIALHRAGKVAERDVMDAADRLARTASPDDLGEVEATAAELEADPTTPTPPTPINAPSANTGRSGKSISDDSPGTAPRPTGNQPSGTTAPSAQRTSVG